VTGYKPAATITIDSTKVSASALATLEQTLYGTAGVDPALPTPDAVLAMFSGTVTVATPTPPTYDAGTHTITIPTVTGVTYYIDDEPVTGTYVLTSGQTKVVVAEPNSGYEFPAVTDNDWLFSY
jgi:hypothetical protein